MKRIYSLLLVICMVFVVVMNSCETTDLDLTEDPNALNPDDASTNGYINSIQVDFGRLIASLEVEASETVRILNMDGRVYQQAFSPVRFNEEWEDAYQKILADVRRLIPLAEEAEEYYHIGMAQVLEAYVIITLVDLFGDVPYQEAFQGQANFNPGVAGDGGESVYVAAVGLLDDAIENFERDAQTEPSDDLFYGGNWDNWIKAANSIKMKIYVTTRLVDPGAADAFNAIVASGDYIDEVSEDFQFPWGTSFNNPDARHPNYVSDYTPSGANTYMSNWYMDYMQSSKVGNGNIAFESADPRMKYYFYRQTDFIPNNPNLIDCAGSNAPSHYGADDAYCSLNNGYWGRDHGDDAGVPPDGQLRTTFGVYPTGGRFDDNSFEVIASISLGAGGAGITPIMLASWTDIMRAEMALEVGNDAGAANILLQSGITKSFEKVRLFGARDANADFSTAPSVDLDAAYVREVGQLFAAAGADERLDLLGSEYFVTLFGNGLDGFNFYRRTGRPSTLQPNLERPSEVGEFFRSFLYPPVFVERNSSVSQKTGVTDQVFWDPGTTLLAN